MVYIFQVATSTYKGDIHKPKSIYKKKSRPECMQILFCPGFFLKLPYLCKFRLYTDIKVNGKTKCARKKFIN